MINSGLWKRVGNCENFRKFRTIGNWSIKYKIISAMKICFEF